VAVTVNSFLEAYPEFTALSEEQVLLVPAILARAERRIGDSWEEEIRDDIVELQAAHMLALTPAGRAAKLSSPGEPTAYQEELMVRKKGHAFGRMRIV
jgi:hypothetical protein